MSDASVTTAGEPTIVLDPSTGKPSAAAQTTESPAKTSGKPEWLDGRLAEATQSGVKKGLTEGKTELLKELGFASLEEAKKSAEEAAAAREAKKSAAQKAAEAEASLKTLNERLEANSRALVGYAQAELQKLSDAQRKAVTDVAGDDPALQLKTITALSPTWASAAAPAAAAAQDKPKDTLPAPSAPKDGGNAPAPDLKAIYNEWKDRNPVWAARFAEANGLFTDWIK